MPEVRSGRPRGAPHPEGTKLLRVPALPGVRLLDLEPPGRGPLPELRVRRDGGEADQDQGDLSQVPQVRTRNHGRGDRKSTRLNSSHQIISYAVFCLKKKKTK